MSLQAFLATDNGEQLLELFLFADFECHGNQFPHQLSDLLPDIEDVAVERFVLVIQRPFASLLTDQHFC